MKKGASYIIVLVLIAAALFWLYSSGPRFTGYAVFEQIGEVEFNVSGAVYENITHDVNGSLVLDVNQTTGAYTSKVFDANSSIIWNNLTWTENIPANTSISWQVRSCATSNCSDANFIARDLNNLNLTGQYFQYQVSFSGYISTDNATNVTTLISPTLASVTISSSSVATPVVMSVTINEPSGTKDIDSGIPIEFSVTGGENISLSCWYNLKYVSDDTIVIVNTTLADCNSSSFDVPDEGDYVLNLYVNSSAGLFHDDSSFSVSLSTETEETSETTTEESEGESSVQIPVTPSFKLIATELSAISLASGGSQEVIWPVSSTGRSAVSACSVNSLGDYASWIVVSGDTLNINAGEEGIFAFSVLVPEEIEEGSYLLSVSIECAETAVSKDFSVEVSGITEEIGEGAPVGGFVIFGEGGLGVGGIIILVFVVLALGAVLFFARRMRKSGKTLRDIFNNLKFVRRPQQQ